MPFKEYEGMKEFNGTIYVGDKPDGEEGAKVEVKDGIATDEDGNQVFISKDGKFVINKQHGLVGMIIRKLVPPDEATKAAFEKLMAGGGAVE